MQIDLLNMQITYLNANYLINIHTSFIDMQIT